ncbi:MAG: hypothetical protein WEB88_06150 [Gemmatimonadota bacterium]
MKHDKETPPHLGRARRRQVPASALAALALLLLPGCNRSALLNCIPAASPALNVTIVESGTGAFLAAGATAVAVDGGHSETLVPGDYAPSGELASRMGLFGRAGSYTITVTHSGYETWTGTARAGSGACGVVTVPVRAELQAAAAP